LKAARLDEVLSGATLTGDLNYEFYYGSGKNNESWRYFSIPMTGITGADLSNAGWDITGETEITDGCSTGNCVSKLTSSSIYTYDVASEAWATVTYTDNLLAGFTFDCGKGYSLWDYDNTSGTSFTLTGTPVIGDQEMSLDNTGEGWNLVGNPYMSAIDWNELTKSGLKGTYQVTDNSSGAIVYATWNGLVGTNGGTGFRYSHNDNSRS